ncbi:hypothetical protein [Bacillus infantis]|uniref:hypothetical protein n=1 Tax=Bacillus infantis TaxID=324767 RepID=UPI002155DB26|nr:hypothetical protein [Bacillus infantis]MCR6612560.1 hypothetical protein [Bacillus infantis]
MQWKARRLLQDGGGKQRPRRMYGEAQRRPEESEVPGTEINRLHSRGSLISQ